MLCYIAYPTSLMLQSANALQTYTTLRELRARRPDTLALIPRWGREPTRFAEVGALHLPRPAIGKLSRVHRSTLLYYLEHTAFAWMCAAVVAHRQAAARWQSPLAGIDIRDQRLALERGKGRKGILREGSEIQNPKSKIEAVYVRQIVCAAWWSAVLGPRLGIPVIYEAHDLEARNPSRAKEPWAQGLLHLMDRVALRQSAAVVSLTDDFRRYLGTSSLRCPDAVYVIPDAYDERLFSPQDRANSRVALGLPADADILAYAGMTFAHRWLEGLLEAIVRLSASHRRLLLLIVGGRPSERAALRQQAEALGLAVLDNRRPSAEDSTRVGNNAAVGGRRSAVVLIEPRPQAEIARYLNAADVLVIPDTVTDITASPLKLFEYLALGQPLVLPDLPALHEIVPASLAHYFPRRDVGGLTQALAAALHAGADAERTAARRALAQNHTYGRRAERILDVVDRVVAASQQTS